MIKIVNYTHKPYSARFDNEVHEFESGEAVAYEDGVARWFCEVHPWAICTKDQYKDKQVEFQEDLKSMAKPDQRDPRKMSKPELLWWLKMDNHVANAKSYMTYAKLIELAETLGLLPKLTEEEAAAQLRPVEPKKMFVQSEPAAKPVVVAEVGSLDE